MKVKPSPNCFKKKGISSSINCCNTFSDILSLKLFVLIIIASLTKSLIFISSLVISLFLVSSGSLSYSLDLILCLNSLSPAPGGISFTVVVPNPYILGSVLLRSPDGCFRRTLTYSSCFHNVLERLV